MKLLCVYMIVYFFYLSRKQLLTQSPKQMRLMRYVDTLAISIVFIITYYMLLHF